MEETQMPSAGVPQEPTPDANPNPPVSSPEQAPAPTPKKGGGLIKILVGVFAIAILGFGGWYAYDSGLFGGDSDDTPPALSIAGAGFQGKSVETTFGFLQFDAADESSYQPPSGASFKAASKGVNYLALKKSQATFADIVDSIQPKEGLKILLAEYNPQEPWAGDTTKNGCFQTYPVGPYQNTCEIFESVIGSKIVDKNKALAIIASDDFEYDSNLLGDAKTLADTLTIGDFTGWTMHPLAASMDLTDSRIRNIWIQKSANEFEKVTDVAGIDPAREYKMVWLKLGDALPAGDATGGGETTPAPSVCGDGNVDSGEACDDGTNNSDTIANACRTTCVVAACGDGVVDTGEECDGSTDCEADCTLTPAAPVCGDGNVDPGEECDGTADCESDCTLTPVVTEVCGNNTIDGSDVCDGTDLGGKNCINYVAGSIFSEGTLGCAADCSAYDTSACATGAPSGGSSTSTTSTGPTASIGGVGSISLGSINVSDIIVTGGTSGPTPTGNAYLERVVYLDNIENEFPGINFPSNIKGQLYGPKDDGTSSSYIPVTAIEVKAGGTTGNIKLNLARFNSTGYTQDDTNAQLEYCNGAGDWEFYRIQESANGGVNDQVVFILKENMAAERGHYMFEDTSAFDYDPIAATINAGESAVFFLLMEDMSACHDESNNAGTSWSQTDITKLIFTEGDLGEKIYLKTDLIHHELNRNIYWE